MQSNDSLLGMLLMPISLCALCRWIPSIARQRSAENYLSGRFVALQWWCRQRYEPPRTVSVQSTQSDGVPAPKMIWAIPSWSRYAPKSRKSTVSSRTWGPANSGDITTHSEPGQEERDF